MRHLASLALIAALAAPSAWAAENDEAVSPADAGARAVFQSVAAFYGDIDALLADGWHHLQLTESQSIHLLRASLSAYGSCLAARDRLPDERIDDPEVWCAEMLVAGLEEVLGPARWSGNLHAVYRP